MFRFTCPSCTGLGHRVASLMAVSTMRLAGLLMVMEHTLAAQNPLHTPFTFTLTSTW